MQRSREQLLPRAALPFEQHRRIGGGGPLERRKELPERRILADQLRRTPPHRELLLEQQVLGDDPPLLERAADEQQEVVGIHRLGEEVHRPFLHRRDRVLDAAIRGHDDDGDVRIDLFRRAEHAEPVPLRETQVRQDERGLVLLQQAKGARWMLIVIWLAAGAVLGRMISTSVPRSLFKSFES